MDIPSEESIFLLRITIRVHYMKMFKSTQLEEIKMHGKNRTLKWPVLMLVVALLFVALPATKVMGQGGETWSVCLEGTCDFDTIQSAIDSASDGDTILVEPGTYAEEITLSVPNRQSLPPPLEI